MKKRQLSAADYRALNMKTAGPVVTRYAPGCNRAQVRISPAKIPRGRNK